MYPLTVLLKNTSLAVTVFSYDGRLNWGFIADYRLVPDLGEFAGLILIWIGFVINVRAPRPVPAQPAMAQ